MSFLDKFVRYEVPNFGYVKLPYVNITPEERIAAGAKPDDSNEEFLRKLIWVDFKKKVAEKDKERAIARIKKEYETICRLGFTDYILLLWKMSEYADKNGIARGPARGSAAGCYIFYLMGVVKKADALKYDLLFERFISEARAKSKVIDGQLYIDGKSAPDVDMDYSSREKIVSYLNGEYPNKVCKIGNRATLTGKKLIKECLKIVEGADESAAKEVADLIPKIFGVVGDIEETYHGKTDASGKVTKEPVKEFVEWVDKHKKTFDIALKLRDLQCNSSVHASGYIVADRDLSEFIPVELVKDTESETKAVQQVSSYTMEDIAQLTTKIDILQVRACQIIEEVSQEVGLDIEALNVDDDPDIFDPLQNFEAAMGIFQAEAPVVKRVVQLIKPKNINEYSDCIALGRPGSLAYVNDYAAGTAECPHEFFKDVLGPTRNLCLYQEQLMQLLVKIGFTLVEADTCRRIVGKKLREEVAEWEQKIYDRCKENGFEVSIGEMVWKVLRESADYSFNRSHSLSYAIMSAITIKLRTCYPLQFFRSLLAHTKDEPNPIDEISKIQAELKYFGIKLLPPDLSKSEIGFTIEGQNIRFGLSSIKGISEKTIDKLLGFKTPHTNRLEVFEAAKNAGLNISVLCALIYSGCLDEVRHGDSRAYLAVQAHVWNILSDKEKQIALGFAEQCNYNVYAIVKKMHETNDSKGKPYIKDSRYATISKKNLPNKEVFEKNKGYPEITEIVYERGLIGYSYSHKLQDTFNRWYEGLMTIQEIIDSPADTKINFVAFVKEKPVERTSKNKNKYCEFELTDETGSIKTMLFNNGGKMDSVKAKHGGKFPEEDSIVWARGTKKEDIIFLDDIVSQDIKIYKRYLELKKDKEIAAAE